MDPTDPTARALALLGLLQTGRSWSGAALAERLGISPRTLRRDIDRLRTLGYAVLTRPGPGGTYRLTGGTAMVPLLFDDDEAIAVVTALAVLAPRLGPDDPAQRALAKLQQNLPARLARRAAAAAGGLEVLPEETSVVDPGVIGVLADAAAEAGRVRFTYERSDGAVAGKEGAVEAGGHHSHRHRRRFRRRTGDGRRVRQGRRGRRLHLPARRRGSRGDAAARRGGGSRRALAIQADQRDPAAVARLFERVSAEFGPPNGLVNAAGIGQGRPGGRHARRSGRT